jgi:AcrR family transcriptional regulator
LTRGRDAGTIQTGVLKHLFKTAPPAPATRDRLISAAGAVFARDGYRQASIREICTLAEANVASVKYYFGSKLGLYREAILAGVEQLGARETVPPPASIETFLRHFLELTLVRRHHHPYIGRIMKHELREPTEVLDEVVRSVIRPLLKQISVRIGERLNLPPSSPEVARLAAFSLSFCANLETSRAILERVGLRFPDEPRGVEAFAKHAIEFVLFGVQGRR